AAKFAEILGVPTGSTATRRAALRHTASRRVPTGVNLPAYTPTDPDHALPPLWKRPPVVVAAVGILAAAGLGAWRLAGSRPPPAASLAPTIKRVAVLYFADNSSDHHLRPVADGLTEALIKALGQVRTLSVVSRNGVEPFRGADVSPDSVARAV